MRHSLAVLFGVIASTSLACSSSDKKTGGSAGTDGGGQSTYVAPTGAPVTGAADDAWTWVTVDGAVCRDGSPAGFGVNMHSSSDKVMILLQGGGACFNALTCAANPANFDSSTFSSFQGQGLLDRSNAANPVKDWNYVYVPFCTGDVFAGNLTDVTIPGVSGTQQFVGYKDLGLFLDRIVPTFPHPSEVLNTGFSAGGFGAALTSDLVARKFPPGTNITLVDDSGPPMGTAVLPTCLQKAWRTTWGFDDTFLKDCGTDCPDHDNFALDWSFHLLKEFPKQKGGLIETTDDGTITLFYGYGTNDCATPPPPGLPTLVPGPAFQAGLLDFRAQITAKTQNFGTYYVAGTQHTWIETASFYTQTLNGTAMSDWVGGIVNGTAISQVGP